MVSSSLPSKRGGTVAAIEQGLLSEVRRQWEEMWDRRFEDKERAEGIADKDYVMLLVEKGLVIAATRDYRLPTLGQVLTYWGLETRGKRYLGSQRPGWGVFIRQTLRQRASTETQRAGPPIVASRRNTLQRKKAGRGWLHR